MVVRYASSMKIGQKWRILIAALAAAVLVTTWLRRSRIDLPKADVIYDYLEQRPTQRHMARSACVLVGLEDEFDEMILDGVFRHFEKLDREGVWGMAGRDVP
jgi:hypothetical protein